MAVLSELQIGTSATGAVPRGSRLRVLQVHCRYRHATGGEDSVVEDERRLLVGHGHVVEQFFGANSKVDTQSLAGVVGGAIRSWWNAGAYREIQSALQNFRPDVVHVHNTFAALSPSVFWAAKRRGIPTVMTVHNYRLLCAAGTLLRDGVPCQECVGAWPLAAIRRRCRFSSSFGIGACTAVGQGIHRLLGTYAQAVDGYIALTNFQRQLLIKNGISAEKIHVKPNSAPDLPCGAPGERREKKIVFVGLVSPVKGVDLLLSAWQRIPHHGNELHVIGGGTEAACLRAQFSHVPDVRWLGCLDRPKALASIRSSRWLALPSRWYEGFPVVIAEALGLGTPVLVPDHGCFPEVVEAGENALSFCAGDADSLAASLAHAIATDDAAWAPFSKRAKRLYGDRYSPEVNYSRLREIYAAVMRPEQYD